ncbi:MAG: DNA polymerase III subunit delta', partial [Aeromicrobium sp.]
RDVIAVQCAPGTELVNADVSDDVGSVARVWTPESTLRRIDAIVECREALDANAAPQLALERMMIGFLP